MHVGTATGTGSCELHWASLACLTPAHADLLDATERRRCARLGRAGDRRRFVLATALLRVAAGAWLGLPPRQVQVDRTCERCFEPHGRPRLPGTPLHASLSHAGEYAAVALSDSAPLGVDIEPIGRVAYPRLLDTVCTASERRHVRGAVDFYAYWTRKESILKATGVGLSLPMTEVAVTPPTEPPRVLAYDGGAGLEAQMFERRFDPRYACSVTILTRSPIDFRFGEGELLLAGA